MLLVLVAAVIAMITSVHSERRAPSPAPTTTQLLTGLEGGSGSTVGPGGALYVTESAAGRISRVDPRTGEITTFASGLPKSIIGIGGTIDVAFIGGTAYALVTVVGPDVGGSDIVGIYRVDGPDSFTVVADIGAFALSNPPGFPFDIPTGVQYALETYRGGFLVTDGHHNRVLPGHARRRGQRADRVRQHRPDRAGDLGQHGLHGRGRPRPPRSRGRQGGVVRAEVTQRHGGGLRCPTPRRRGVWPRSRSLRPLAGRLRWRPSGFSGAAEHRQPREGERERHLHRRRRTALDRPTSVEFIRNTAYVVTLTGEIWKVENVSGPPHGASH